MTHKRKVSSSQTEAQKAVAKQFLHQQYYLNMVDNQSVKHL
jgi:Na+-translocating ferredoxin:NAD+ oxidoreductase RnfG subunit